MACSAPTKKTTPTTRKEALPWVTYILLCSVATASLREQCTRTFCHPATVKCPTKHIARFPPICLSEDCAQLDRSPIFSALLSVCRAIGIFRAIGMFRAIGLQLSMYCGLAAWELCSKYLSVHSSFHLSHPRESMNRPPEGEPCMYVLDMSMYDTIRRDHVLLVGHGSNTIMQ